MHAMYQTCIWILAETLTPTDLPMPGNLINYAVTFVTLHVVGSEGTSAVAAVGLAMALYTCLGGWVGPWGAAAPFGNGLYHRFMVILGMVYY